jgi:peptide/nickel transport system permease protein
MSTWRPHQRPWGGWRASGQRYRPQLSLLPGGDGGGPHRLRLRVCALFAGWVAPHNPFDLTTLELSDARLPPAWSEAGSRKYLLGTDDQGRDILSAVIYGARISLVVGVVSVILSVLVGVSLGLLAGFRGGWIDAALMRLCDVMLSFPAILVALLIAGVGAPCSPMRGTGWPLAC